MRVGSAIHKETESGKIVSGGMAERLNAPVLKTVRSKVWGFESLFLRHFKSCLVYPLCEVDCCIGFA